MFRDRNFLIRAGLDSKSRKDTCFIIGSIYDEVIESGVIDRKRIEDLREFLDKNREIIGGKDYFIVSYKKIKEKMEDLLEVTNDRKDNLDMFITVGDPFSGGGYRDFKMEDIFTKKEIEKIKKKILKELKPAKNDF